MLTLDVGLNSTRQTSFTKCNYPESYPEASKKEKDIENERIKKNNFVFFFVPPLHFLILFYNRYLQFLIWIL